MPTKAVNIRMDEELLKYLQEEAKKQNRTLSNMIITILLRHKNNEVIDRQTAINHMDSISFESDATWRQVVETLEGMP